MARISKEERSRKLEFINDSIWELFLENGWGEVTYHNVSAKTGIRQSSLQSYHKTSSSFGSALKGRAFPYVMSRLDFTTASTLEHTWTNSLADSGFRNIIWLLVGHVTESNEINLFAKNGLVRLIDYSRGELGEAGFRVVEHMIGRTALEMALKYKNVKPEE